MIEHVDGALLRTVMRRVASPVTVVTARAGDERRGITIGSFTSVSLDPPLISFNVERIAQMHPVLLAAERFNVHVLTNEQAHLSNHFALPDLSGETQFAGLDVRPDAHGTPLLPEALAVLACTPYGFYEAGDHTIVVGEVEAVAMVEDEVPLLYFDRRYVSVGDEVEPLSLLGPVKRSSSASP